MKARRRRSARRGRRSRRDPTGATGAAGSSARRGRCPPVRATSGTTLVSVASRLKAPDCTRPSSAVAVSAFVIEPIRNSVLASTGSWLFGPLLPKPWANVTSPCSMSATEAPDTPICCRSWSNAAANVVYFCGIAVSPEPAGSVDPEQPVAIPPTMKRANVDSVPRPRVLATVIMGANGKLGR